MNLVSWVLFIVETEGDVSEYVIELVHQVKFTPTHLVMTAIPALKKPIVAMVYAAPLRLVLI